MSIAEQGQIGGGEVGGEGEESGAQPKQLFRRDNYRTVRIPDVDEDPESLSPVTDRVCWDALSRSDWRLVSVPWPAERRIVSVIPPTPHPPPPTSLRPSDTTLNSPRRSEESMFVAAAHFFAVN